MVAPPAPGSLAPLAIPARRRAVVPIALLPARLDLAPDDVATPVDSAVAAGLVASWEDAEAGPSGILSAAESAEGCS